MLKKIPINAYYFSGSGNTEKLATHFMKTLKEKGFVTNLYRMELSKKIEAPGEYTLGLMLPVAMQSTYPLVWDFVQNLPHGKGRDVFMLDTMEVFSGGIIGPMKKVLSTKGYKCIGAGEFRMSSSLNRIQSKVEPGREKNSRALAEVEKYAFDLIKGKTKWKRIALLSDLIKTFSSGRKVWIVFSKKITITNDCIGCRICIRKCPTQAIELTSDKVSIRHEICNVCMRCFSVCPQNAFRFEGKKILLSK